MLLQLADECEERQEKEPFVVVLDSLGAVSNILEYLTVEWNTNNIIDKSEANFPFDSSEIVVVTPRCPGQSDTVLGPSAK